MSTTRFAYITDTHIGGDAGGFHIQPRYLGLNDVIYKGFARWLKENDVAFVMHGGDLIEHGTDEQMDLAVSLYGLLDVPTYLCFGNHDLCQPDAMVRWRERGGLLLPNGSDCYAIDAGAATVVVVGHHWDPRFDHRWVLAGPQDPRIDARQEKLIGELMRDAGRPVIAVTHAPLNDVPAEQRGVNEPFHPPFPPYLQTWQRIAAEHANLKLVMCGHNHAHSNHDHGSFISTTSAAFCEMPAQLRLITVSPRSIDVQTVALAEAIGLPVELDANAAWSVGPAKTHSLSIGL